MRKLIYAVLALVTLASCARNGCVIKGRIDDEDPRNGKRVFLVPAGPHENSDVDSTVVKNGTFSFKADSEMVAIVKVHNMFGQGLQELLIVTEPGVVNVTLSANSKGSGTRQNDSLQIWKQITMDYNMAMRTAPSAEDRVAIREAYRERTREMAEGLGDCVLGRWLSSMFPEAENNQ